MKGDRAPRGAQAPTQGTGTGGWDTPCAGACPKPRAGSVQSETHSSERREHPALSPWTCGHGKRGFRQSFPIAGATLCCFFFLVRGTLCLHPLFFFSQVFPKFSDRQASSGCSSQLKRCPAQGMGSGSPSTPPAAPSAPKGRRIHAPCRENPQKQSRRTWHGAVAPTAVFYSLYLKGHLDTEKQTESARQCRDGSAAAAPQPAPASCSGCRTWHEAPAAPTMPRAPHSPPVPGRAGGTATGDRSAWFYP